MTTREGIFEIDGYKVFTIDGEPIDDSPFEEVTDLSNKQRSGKVESESGSDFLRAQWQAPDKLKERNPQVIGRFWLRGDGESGEDICGKPGDYEVAVEMPELRKGSGEMVFAGILVPAEEIRRVKDGIWRNGDGRTVKIDNQ